MKRKQLKHQQASSLIKEFNKNIFMRKIKSKESGTQADNRNSDKIDNHQFYRYFFIFLKISLPMSAIFLIFMVIKAMTISLINRLL